MDNNSSARSNAERFLNTMIYDLMDNSNNVISMQIPNVNNIPVNTEENFDDMPELESGSDMSIDSDDDIPELE